jgi:hypothetical protein
MQCVKCKERAFFMCGACKQRPYCGKSCQSTDRRHLDQCVTFNLIQGKDDKKRKTEQEKDNFLRDVKDYVLNNKFTQIKDGIANNFLSSEEINDLLQYTRSPAMAHILVCAGADVYTYIGKGMVALDEMVKHFPIREFLQEAQEETPEGITRLLEEARKAIDGADIEDQTIGFSAETLQNNFNIELNLYTLRHLMYHGFVAQSWNISETIFEHIFFRRYNAETLRYWTKYNMKDYLETDLENVPKFVYNSIDHIKAKAEVKPDSFLLLLFAPHLVYKESKRAMTTMRQFFDPAPRYISGKEMSDKPNNHIRVTRYAAGMSRGLYFNNDDDEKEKQTYCGTFYYQEPGSNVVLKYNNPLKAIDKSKAGLELAQVLSAGSLPDSNNMKIADDLLELSNRLRIRFPLGVERKFMLTPVEYNNVYLWTAPEMDLSKPGLQLEREYYAINHHSYYAHQDDLDQKICVVARALKYDVVLLTHMIGSRQIVYEVMDTRSREESFANLFIIKD